MEYSYIQFLCIINEILPNKKQFFCLLIMSSRIHLKENDILLYTDKLNETYKLTRKNLKCIKNYIYNEIKRESYRDYRYYKSYHTIAVVNIWCREYDEVRYLVKESRIPIIVTIIHCFTNKYGDYSFYEFYDLNINNY